MSKRQPKRRRTPRPVSDQHTLIQGNRDYILALRKGLSQALRDGHAAVRACDADDDDIVTTIVCSCRFGRRVGFAPPSSDAD